MTQQTGTNDIDLTDLADGWSKVVINVLQVKLARMKIRQTGSLFDSLKFDVSGQGSSFQLYFSYNLYGKFVDMGVGRNYALGNPGNVEKVKYQRNRKEWLSRIFYAQVMTLGELARKQCGEAAKNTIIATFQNLTYRDIKAHEYRHK